ncbi:MAG: hypothetical protein GC154_20335 [bacterium]|nr:hypothetical protein [bacterium]
MSFKPNRSLMLIVLLLSMAAAALADSAPISASDGRCPTEGIEPSFDYDCAEQYGGILLPGEYGGEPALLVYACIPASLSGADGVCLMDLGIACRAGGHDPDCDREPAPLYREGCGEDGVCDRSCMEDPDCGKDLGEPCLSNAECHSGYCSRYSYDLGAGARMNMRFCVEKAGMVDGPKCALIGEDGQVHGVQVLGDKALGLQSEKAPFGYVCSKEGVYYGCILVQGTDSLWVTTPRLQTGDECRYCDSDADCGPVEFCDGDRACKDARGRAEICGDGRDNNANGLIDAADAGCSSPPEGAVDALSFSCIGATPGLNLSAWSFDPDNINAGAVEIRFYHKNPADTSALYGTYLGHTTRLPVTSRPDIRHYALNAYFTPEYASSLATDRFGVLGIAAFDASVPASLRRVGTTLYVSAYAMDRSGDSNRKLPLNQGDDTYSGQALMLTVGSCEGEFSKEGASCAQDAECSMIASPRLSGTVAGYCSHGANKQFDVGHCCPQKDINDEVYWWDGDRCVNARLDSLVCKASATEIAAAGVDRVAKCPYDLRSEVKRFFYKLFKRDPAEIDRDIESRCVRPQRGEKIVNGLRSKYQACVYLDADDNPYGLGEGGFFLSDILIYDPQ